MTTPPERSPIKKPFHVEMKDGSHILITPEDPDSECLGHFSYLGCITNTVQPESVLYDQNGKIFDWSIDYFLFKFSSGRYVEATWHGEPGCREIRGRETTPQDAALAFHKAGKRLPPGLELPNGSILPLRSPQADRSDVADEAAKWLTVSRSDCCSLQ